MRLKTLVRIRLRCKYKLERIDLKMCELHLSDTCRRKNTPMSFGPTWLSVNTSGEEIIENQHVKSSKSYPIPLINSMFIDLKV